MKPHPDEVDAVKWVSLEDMDAMMEDQGKLWLCRFCTCNLRTYQFVKELSSC